MDTWKCLEKKLEIYTTKYEQWLFNYDGNIADSFSFFLILNMFCNKEKKHKCSFVQVSDLEKKNLSPFDYS